MSKITPQTVSGIVNSNQSCFRSLYDAYYSYLCGIAMFRVHDSGVARELVNDVFLRVWQHRASLKYPPLPYLISGVRNACYNYLRDNGKSVDVKLVNIDRAQDVQIYSDEDVDEIVRRISDISTSLPSRCAEVFSLHFDEDLDTAEIAGRLGISQSTVRGHLKIALDRIREEFKK